MQVLEIAEDRAAHGPRLEVEQRADAGQHGGVEAIGLGKLPSGFGKAPVGPLHPVREDAQHRRELIRYEPKQL
jgi:hypothetical protein